MRLVYRSRNEDINEYMNSKDLIKVVWGINFAKQFMEECPMQIDYFCDRKARSLGGYIRYINDIPVVTKDELNMILNMQNKRALIIICVGPNKGVVGNIYLEMCLLDMNADVFDYFENTKVFSDKSFSIDEEEIPLYEHLNNCGNCDTRMTERSVELALAKRYLKRCDGVITEVGAVTPYYSFDFGNKIEHIVDPTDPHSRVDIKESLFDCNFSEKNVLSISTVEHVGTGDFSYSENYTAVDAMNKLIEESRSCLITAPTGYNFLLDRWLEVHKWDSYVKILKRNCNNKWQIVYPDDYKEIEYTQYWANGLIVVEKNDKTI